MNWIAPIGGLVGLVIAGAAVCEAPQSSPAAGEQHEIVVSYQTSQKGSDGSSSSSSGRDTMLERVIAVSDRGVELEFDLPRDATAEDRARTWKYPARVLQPASGAMQLLNGAELESRIDPWLAAAQLTRRMCGRWIFTWNAFRIECDPQSVIADIEAINLLSVDLRDGAVYRHPQTHGSGELTRAADGPDGAIFFVSMGVDVDAVRKSRAENDVVVGEITQQPVTLESALRERSMETLTGQVEITFSVDAAGNPTRRTTVTTLDTVRSDGVIETEKSTVTVNRRPVSAPLTTEADRP